MKYYSCSAIDKLSALYIEKGGYSYKRDDTIVLSAPGYKTAVVKVICRPELSDIYTIRLYNQCPKKYSMGESLWKIAKAALSK